MDPIRLNSGGDVYTDTASNNWAPDSFFTGGDALFNTATVTGTSDQTLYKYYRKGAATNPMTYTIPLSTPGTYTATLKFMEPATNAITGTRDVEDPGQPALLGRS